MGGDSLFFDYLCSRKQQKPFILSTMNYKRILSFLLLLVVAVPVVAQSHDKVVRKRIDSLITARYFSGDYDTAYIGRPRERLTLKLRGNLSGSNFDIDRRIEGAVGRSRLGTDHKATISIGANYRGITAGLALNPASLSGRNKDYELNLNAYTNRYGIDVIYQASKTLSGNMTFNGTDLFLEKGMADMQVLNINGYWAFSGRRFSYPAAFTQSYVQKRSAGSWLVGFSYMGGRLKTTDKKFEGAPDFRVFVGHFALGGGYGYNLMLHKRLLLHLSVLPNLVVLNLNNIRIDGEKSPMRTRFPDFIFTERAAIVYYFSPKYFTGATFVTSSSLLSDHRIDINYRKWRLRVFLGLRLWR